MTRLVMRPPLKSRLCVSCLAPQHSSSTGAPRVPFRHFTTTRQTCAPPRTNPLSLLAPDTPPPPPYPYAPARWYKQSNKGLYGGRVVQFGNNVSEEHDVKTRRRWHPNIVAKNIFSRALGRNIRVMISTRVLRTMDRVGGLDEYLIGNKPARVKELGVQGWKLRWAVLNAPGFKKRVNQDEKVKRLLGSPVEAIIPAPQIRSREQSTSLVEEEILDEEIADRILGRHHMEEAPPPPPSVSIWQRLSRTVTKPFTRS